MAPTPLQQVQSLLAQMGASDRKKVALLVGRFKGSDSPKLKVESIANDWLLTGFQKELERRGQPFFAASIVRLREMAPNYELASQEVRSRLEKHLVVEGRPASRTELTALGKIAARSLASYIEAWAPVALKPLLLNVERTSEALENSFPGYLAAGMLPLLVGSARDRNA